MDRQKNNLIYPELCYPDIYLLQGGYKEFFEQSKVRVGSAAAVRPVFGALESRADELSFAIVHEIVDICDTLKLPWVPLLIGAFLFRNTARPAVTCR